jgi:hypothetical protein
MKIRELINEDDQRVDEFLPLIGAALGGLARGAASLGGAALRGAASIGGDIAKGAEKLGGAAVTGIGNLASRAASGIEQGIAKAATSSGSSSNDSTTSPNPAVKTFNDLLTKNKIDPAFVDAYVTQSQNPNATLSSDQQKAMSQFALAILQNPQLATQMATVIKQLAATSQQSTSTQ